MPSQQDLKTERRLTVLEVTQESHGERLEELEAKQITLRDWFMIAAGLATIAAAISGKIDWPTALTLLAKNS